MIFNFWRRYPKHKPKKDGTYLCTISYDSGKVSYPAILQYTVWNDEWTDVSRQGVFEGYKVYEQCRATIEDNRVYEDNLSKPKHIVVAFKKLPKTYGRSK